MLDMVVYPTQPISKSFAHFPHVKCLLCNRVSNKIDSKYILVLEKVAVNVHGSKHFSYV